MTLPSYHIRICPSKIFFLFFRYEMYAGDGKPAISVTADVSLPDASGSNPSAPPNIEPGTAVEVLELANGETIWYVITPIDTQRLINRNRISTIGLL